MPLTVRGFVSPDKDSLFIFLTFLRKKESSMRKFAEVTIQHQPRLAGFFYEVFNLTFFTRIFFFLYIYKRAYIKN